MALVGLVVLAIAADRRGLASRSATTLRVPPDPWSLVQPAINLAALGLPIYGYTLLASSLDHVRWRPTWIGSSLTLAGFIAFVIAMIPVFSEMWWRPWLERVSIFKAYNPIEVVTKGGDARPAPRHPGGRRGACILLAFVVFAVRDLPANG